jgi:hypothetical protein
MATESRSISARISAEHRWHPEADHAELYRDRAVQRIAESIQELVASAPAPSPEQIDRLRNLLRP